MKKYEKYKDSGVEWIGEIPAHWISGKLKYVLTIQSGKGISPEEVFPEGEFPVYGGNGILGFTGSYSSDGEYLIIGRVGALCGNVHHVKGKIWISDNALWAEPKCDMIFLKYYLQYFDLNKLANKNAQPLITGTMVKDQFIGIPSIKEQTAIANYLDRKTQQLDTLISKKQNLITLLEEERTALINHAVTKGLDPSVPMKDSGIEWLGEIPAHWEVKKLKYVAKINNSKPSFEFNRKSEEEVVFLPMEKVSENGNITQDLRRKISEISSGFTYFEKDDVLVAKITPCFENGKGALLSDLESSFGYGSTEFHTIKASKLILKEFIYFLTKSERFMTIGAAFMSGSAGQKRVPTSFLENFSTGMPSIEEQTNIVIFIQTQLKQFNTIITKTQQEIELLKEYKTALISEVVTGKVDVRGEVLETGSEGQ